MNQTFRPKLKNIAHELYTIILTNGLYVTISYGPTPPDKAPVKDEQLLMPVNKFWINLGVKTMLETGWFELAGYSIYHKLKREADNYPYAFAKNLLKSYQKFYRSKKVKSNKDVLAKIKDFVFDKPEDIKFINKKIRIKPDVYVARIKELKFKGNFTTTQAAKRCNMSNSMFYAIETGVVTATEEQYKKMIKDLKK